MKTALLLTTSAQTQQFLRDILGDAANIIAPPPVADPDRAQYDALFAQWLRLTDLLFIDAASLGETCRWPVESAAALAGNQTVIVRITDRQRSLFQLPGDWIVVADTAPAEQLAAQLQLRDVQQQLRQSLNRQAIPVIAPVAPAAGMDAYRYRDALKTLSRVLAQNLDQPALLQEFLRLARDLFGTGKAVLFTRRDAVLIAVAHTGIAPHIIEHVRLSEQNGIGAFLARETRVLRRSQAPDAQAAREFDLLGVEVAVPVFDDGRLLGVLACSGKITGETLTNEELELAYHLMGQLAQALRHFELRDRLAAQQRLLTEVVDNVQTGVVVAAESGQILRLNAHARQLLDLESPAEKLSALPAMVADVIFEGLMSGRAVEKREVTLPRVHRPLRISVSRLPAGGPAVALLEDLTQERLQQAQAKELADKEFFQRVALRIEQELRNAVTSISAFSQLLPEKHADKEFREEFSSTVNNEIKRVRLLVDNLRFFSSTLALSPEPVVLSDLIDRCVKNITEECERRRVACLVVPNEKIADDVTVPVIVVKRNFAHKTVVIEGDRIRLIQAFEHVLRNAVLAMKKGGRLIINSKDAAPEGEAVEIDWQDTGEGIALEQLPHVTEPFVTSRVGVVGLGLTIVKEIVERHGGRLKVDSMLGAGTTVTMVLPVKAKVLPNEETESLGDETAVGETMVTRGPVTPKLKKPIVEKKNAQAQNFDY